jgi:hypothetical protein
MTQSRVGGVHPEGIHPEGLPAPQNEFLEISYKTNILEKTFKFRRITNE